MGDSVWWVRQRVLRLFVVGGCDRVVESEEWVGGRVVGQTERVVCGGGGGGGWGMVVEEEEEMEEEEEEEEEEGKHYVVQVAKVGACKIGHNTYIESEVAAGTAGGGEQDALNTPAGRCTNKGTMKAAVARSRQNK
ncbi:hypothetical protein Pcinc_033272 [Petrolisthes cinctipes]|uniref:Uncharacterized protein n=1 Tax=Petrolisthes cinctipes TaxID=88211 RepID=A0AAE1ESM9_PETCI|nr:hypothetical protein Pcinc_033272 [Petrolisthes cinctipes]